MTALLAFSLLAFIPHDSYPMSNGKDLFPAKESSLLVVAFAETCPHSVKEMPVINKLASALKGKVRVVGVLERDMTKTKAFAKKLGATFPIVSDTSGHFAAHIGAEHSLDFATLHMGEVKSKSDGFDAARVNHALGALGVASSELTFLPQELLSGCSIN